MICTACGSDQTGQDVSATTCSECGAPLFGPNEALAPPRAGSGAAGKVIGAIVGFFVAWFGVYWMLNGSLPVGSISSGTTSKEWADFESPDRSFHACFPAEPEHKKLNFPLPTGRITIHGYIQKSLFGGDEFSVAYFDVPPGTPFNSRGAHQGAIAMATRRLKHHSTTRMKFAGHSATEIRGEFRSGKKTVTYVFSNGARWYTVCACGHTLEDRSRFLRSFGLGGLGDGEPDDVPREWVSYESTRGGFRCDFPGRPSFEQEWGERHDTQAYVAGQLGNEAAETFTVFYRDLSADEAKDPHAAIDRALQSTGLPEDQAESEEVTVGGLAGRHVEWPAAEGQKVSALRVFVVEGRLFGLLAESAERKRAEHFYGNFTLLKDDDDATLAEADRRKPADGQVPSEAHEALEDPLVRELVSSDSSRVNRAFRRLARESADPARWEIVRALEFVMLKSDSKTHRRRAAEALGDWANEASVPSLVRALDDESTFVADAAMKPLGRLATPQALKALTVKFQESRFRHAAGNALVEAGPDAVLYINRLVRDSRDDFVRAEACDLLARIGTANARACLSSLQDDRSGLVRMKAESALGKLAIGG